MSEGCSRKISFGSTSRPVCHSTRSARLSRGDPRPGPGLDHRHPARCAVQPLRRGRRFVAGTRLRPGTRRQRPDTRRRSATVGRGVRHGFEHQGRQHQSGVHPRLWSPFTGSCTARHPPFLRQLFQRRRPHDSYGRKTLSDEYGAPPRAGFGRTTRYGVAPVRRRRQPRDRNSAGRSAVDRGGRPDLDAAVAADRRKRRNPGRPHRRCAPPFGP